MSEDALLARARAGAHTVVIGEVPVPAELLVIPIHCDLGGPPLAPLVELCLKIEARLGDEVDGSRRRFAGRPAARRMYPGRLAGTLNRLAASTPGPAAAWFHAFDRIDPASREMVLACLAEPDWVRLPLVFALEGGGEVADQLVAALGAGCVIEGASPASEELPELPDDVLRALRAAAIAGDAFEIETVAELLVEDPVTVLEQLQNARDRGVPIRDRGDGVLALPPGLAGSLRASLLPSLRQAWNLLLAQAHGTPIDASDDSQLEALPELPPLPDLESIYGTPDTSDLDTAEAILESAGRQRSDTSPPRAPARAARHAVEAGQLEDAVDHLLATARQATEAGAFAEALELIERAEAGASRLPPSPRISALRARAELERGTIAWVAVGSPEDNEMTLPRALDHLDRALAISAAAGDPRLTAEIRATAAGVCFDLGDREALERSIELLTEASRALSEAGLAIEAAQLLNEQASVWVRLGDPVRAYGLLQASRTVFERLDSPEALLEIAGTDHQTARLALHIEARPGRETDAIDLGIALARRAAEVYERFGLFADAAWARETIGRLALRDRRFELATSELQQAFRIQLERGDGNGLARTTAALAELAAQSGDPAGALEALAESVELNIAKGSPIGLAFNLESLERIDPELSLDGAAALAAHIRDAQAEVGVVSNPGALYRGEA